MKFDMYCDWSPAAVGLVVVDQGKGVFYNRYEEAYSGNDSTTGELEAVRICLDLVEELNLHNVTIHTDHLALVEAVRRNRVPACKKTKKARGEAAQLAKQEMYRVLMERIKDFGIEVVHCKSHAGNPFNHAADILARPVLKSMDTEYRLSTNTQFKEAAANEAPIKLGSNMLEVFHAWFINLTHSVALV